MPTYFQVQTGEKAHTFAVLREDDDDEGVKRNFLATDDELDGVCGEAPAPVFLPLFEASSNKHGVFCLAAKRALLERAADDGVPPNRSWRAGRRTLSSVLKTTAE
jgi:hypothetical protein